MFYIIREFCNVYIQIANRWVRRDGRPWQRRRRGGADDPARHAPPRAVRCAAASPKLRTSLFH